MIVTKTKLKKIQGFTLIESVTSMFILGLIVFTVLSALLSTQKSQVASDKKISIYEKADVLLESITSGKTIAKYLLTPSEKSRLISRTLGNLKLNLVVLKENNLKWVLGQRLKTFNQKIKLDGKNYKVEIYRTIIESVPFLWGIELKVSNSKKNFALLKSIVSYYDFF